MEFFGYTEKFDDRVETRTIAQIGHMDHSTGGHYQIGLRFTDDPETLHTVLHHDLDDQSRLEIRMFERGDTCEIVRQSDGKGNWTIRHIRKAVLPKG